MTPLDTLFLILATFFVLMIFIALLIFIIQWAIDFRIEYKYIQNEIERNYGREKEYWKRKKKRLLLSLIPFVRYRK